MMYLVAQHLDSRLSYFSGSDADNLVNRCDDNLAVAYLSSSSALDDGIHNLINLVIPGQDCKKQLGMKVHPVFTPPVNFGAAHLSTETKNIHYRQPLYTDAREALPYIVQTLLPNDGIDPFHLGLLADADLHAALGALLHQWPIVGNTAPDFALLKPDNPSVDLASSGEFSAIGVLLCIQTHNRDPSCAKYLV